MNLQNQCPHCHERFFASHVCKVLNLSIFDRLPTLPKAGVQFSITEEDVRRIVREEIDRLKEQP